MRSIGCGKRILTGLTFSVAATMDSLFFGSDAADFDAVAEELAEAAASAFAVFAEADAAVAVMAVTLAVALAVAVAFASDAAGTAA